MVQALATSGSELNHCCGQRAGVTVVTDACCRAQVAWEYRPSQVPQERRYGRGSLFCVFQRELVV